MTIWLSPSGLWNRRKGISMAIVRVMVKGNPVDMETEFLSDVEYKKALIAGIERQIDEGKLDPDYTKWPKPVWPTQHEARPQRKRK